MHVLCCHMHLCVLVCTRLCLCGCVFLHALSACHMAMLLNRDGVGMVCVVFFHLPTFCLFTHDTRQHNEQGGLGCRQASVKPALRYWMSCKQRAVTDTLYSPLRCIKIVCCVIRYLTFCVYLQQHFSCLNPLNVQCRLKSISSELVQIIFLNNTNNYVCVCVHLLRNQLLLIFLHVTGTVL